MRYSEGYVVIVFLVVMTLITGALSTSVLLLGHLRDTQLLRIKRLQAEALVLSAWTWRAGNTGLALPVSPVPFSPDQIRTMSIPSLDLPIPGDAYLVQSGGTLWAIGFYDDVTVFQSRDL